MSAKAGMRLNDMPVHTQWAFRQDADELRRENKATYERLREVCTRGEAPCGGRTVVRELSPMPDRRRFAVVCTPRRLDMDHIALFCDRGNLHHGYGVARGSVIEVYTG